MEPCAVQRGGACGSVNCVKRMPLPNEPSMPAFRPIVGNVGCVSNVLGKEPRETVLVGSAPSGACCLRLHPSSLKPASFKRRGGWMWRVGLFAAPGLYTGVD